MVLEVGQGGRKLWFEGWVEGITIKIGFSVLGMVASGGGGASEDDDEALFAWKRPDLLSR